MRTGQKDRAALIRCAYELHYYLQVAQDVVIEGVQMLCPPAVNGTSGWSLEDMLQIVFFKGVDSDQSAVLYRTAVGTYKLGDLDLRRKKDSKRLVFGEESSLPCASNF